MLQIRFIIIDFTCLQNEERNEDDFDKKGFKDDGNEMSFL